AFLFVVLFFTFPLKFLMGTLADRLMGGGKTIRLPNGTVERVLRPDHVPLLLTIYGLGFTAVSLIFFLLYAHAYRKREELDLNDLEIFDTRRTVEAQAHAVVVGLFVVMLAQLDGLLRNKPYEDQVVFGAAGVCYLYIAIVLYRTRQLGRRRKAMVARLQEIAAEGDPGPPLQS